MSPNRFILVLLAITPFLISSASAQFKEFDDDCNADADCLSDSFLYCNKYNKCACVNPGVDLAHDPATKKCLIPFGTSCHIQSEVGEPTCTSNSTCTQPEWSNDPSKGFCTCDKGFQGIEKHCLPRIPQDGTCEVPSTSNPIVRQCMEFSECDRNSKKCNCGNGLVYNRYDQECTLKTGATCHIIPEVDKEPICSTNALCERKDWISNPILGQCTCKTGFVNIPSEERCLKQNVPIGEYCEADKLPSLHRCTGLSTCQNGQCDCTVKGADVVEDPNTKICALAIGSTCDTVDVDPTVEVTCSSNSECLKTPWSTKGICGCTSKFEVSPTTRTCLRRLDIGATCEVKEPTHFVPSCIQYAECDGTAKQCNCWGTFEMATNDNTTCVMKGSGLADEPCFLDSPTCTANSACEKMTKKTNALAVDEKDIIGTCKCGLAFFPGVEKLCLWIPNKHNETCEENIQCNHRKSMSCNTGATDKRCTCFQPTTMMYDEPTEECLTLVGNDGTCSLKEENEINIKCVANAECKQNATNPTVGNCVCADGFVATNNNHCEENGANNEGIALGPLVLLLGVLQGTVLMS